MSDDQESIKAIQVRMQQVRRDLGVEVEELVESAKDMTDWRKYVKANPWICLAAAAAVGFIIVPKRAPRYKLNDEQLQNIAKQLGIKRGRSKGGVRQALTSMVTSAVMRGVMGYVSQRMSQQYTKAMEEQKPF